MRLPIGLSLCLAFLSAAPAHAAALKVLTVTGTAIAPDALAGLRRKGVTIHGESHGAGDDI